MSPRELSPREEEIVELCVEGLTNEQIAHRLGLSIGTVNTYWLRIKFKVGGLGKTDTVVKIIKERAERALRDANKERKGLSDIVAERELNLLEYRAALALLHLAMDQIQSTVWATDSDLVIHIIANGELPATHFGVTWEIGKSVYDIFKTDDPNHPAIAAHLAAVAGVESESSPLRRVCKHVPASHAASRRGRRSSHGLHQYSEYCRRVRSLGGWFLGGAARLLRSKSLLSALI